MKSKCFHAKLIIFKPINRTFQKSNCILLNISKAVLLLLMILFHCYWRSVNFEMSIWYFQFFQKTNKKIWLYHYGTSSRIVFIRFSEELKIPKRHFEINWPLYVNYINLLCEFSFIQQIKKIIETFFLFPF